MTPSAYDDDDDWVGTPPEGHHSRDRAKPDFWRSQGPLMQGAGVLLLIVIVVVLIVVAG